MKLIVNAPDGLTVMFIGYVAYDNEGRLYASQHCVVDHEMKDGATITLKKSVYEEE